MTHALILLAALSLSSCDQAQPPPAPTMSTPAGAPAPKPPLPPVKPGMAVFDRTGARIGAVQTLAETDAGPNVVIAIDGKLVGAPVSTLTFREDRVVSSQTKAQLLASAGAPR